MRAGLRREGLLDRSTHRAKLIGLLDGSTHRWMDQLIMLDGSTHHAGWLNSIQKLLATWNNAFHRAF